jgi:predicted lipid-binding transport protein (Tim44 family)
MNIQQVDDTVQENKIKNIIPNFDKTEFLKQGFKIYTDVQEAWMNFELEKVRDKITDELYSMYESQLATLEIKGEQNIMKDMVNKYCYVKDVSQQNNVITITTGYYIEQYDYIADAKTGKLIRGESKKKMRVKYEMKFRKIIDTNNVIEKCPNCGAKMDINSGGICEYCGSKVVSENSDWVLTEKTVLRQDYI